MGVLYLVRHGQAPAHAYAAAPPPPGSVPLPAPGEERARVEGSPPAPLTGLGVAQALATGRELARQVPELTAVVSGDLPRQRATLTGVLDAYGAAGGSVGAERLVDPGWDEYAIPALPGAPAADLYANPAAYQRLLDEALLRWVRGAAGDPAGGSGDPAAGETYAGETYAGETYAEYVARTTGAAQRAADLAGSGRTVLAVSSAGTITALIARLWGVPPESWPALARAMVNASITKLIVGRRGLTVVSVNEHAHLSAVDVGLATFR